MSLHAITATPHPDGNRINLNWAFSPDSVADGVRIVRRETTYPTHYDDGIVVVHEAGITSASDSDLHAERVYYYMLFPYQGEPPTYEIDDKYRVAALATGANGYGDYMYEQLPAIYHRFDRDSEQLKRFLQIPGGQLDQLNSFATFVDKLQNLRETHGAFLPLLGDWIGWKTDFKREVIEQRDEVQNAPSIYKTIELVATVEATVKRISDWESRSKEYVHNIFTANRPEHLNQWSMTRDNGGIWQAAETLVSLDYAFEGRAATAIDERDVRWLFYHTQRKNQWEIWYKTTRSFEIPIRHESALAPGTINTELLNALAEVDLTLAQNSTLASLTANTWQINDGAEIYILQRLLETLIVFHTTAPTQSLADSQPLITGRDNIVAKYPAVALHDDTLWLFWSVYDVSSARWKIQYRSRTDAIWTADGPAEPDPTVDIDRNPFAVAGVYDASRQRRCPYAVTDDSDRLWLFWMENAGAGWQLVYNRRDGTTWGTPVAMPLDGTDDPRINCDLQVMIRPSTTDPRIYVFWSRHEPIATPGLTRSQVVYRVKEDLQLDGANWTPVNSLPKHLLDDNHHDRDVFAVLIADQVEVFWSSNREDSGWSLWTSILTDFTTNNWTAAQRISEGVHSQRTPLPVSLTNELWLLYRSNRHINYTSDIYRATQTVDHRYSGSTAIDVRHQQKLQQKDSYEDNLRYSYDSGSMGVRDDSNRIARDTVGIFLDSDTFDETAISNAIERLRPVMNEFMPVTDRAVFVPTSLLHSEYVYSYGLPPTPSSRFISSTYTDELVSTLVDSALASGEDFTDSLGGA